jgi:hypothetical protein
MLNELNACEMNDKVQELLYMLSEQSDYMIAAVLTVSLIRHLDTIKNGKISEHVIEYLKVALKLQ